MAARRKPKTSSTARRKPKTSRTGRQKGDYLCHGLYIRRKQEPDQPDAPEVVFKSIREARRCMKLLRTVFPHSFRYKAKWKGLSLKRMQQIYNNERAHEIGEADAWLQFKSTFVRSPVHFVAIPNKYKKKKGNVKDTIENHKHNNTL